MQPQNSSFNPYAPPTADVNQIYLAAPDAEYILAERGSRLGAALIDWLLTMAVAVPSFVFLASTFDRSFDDPTVFMAFAAFFVSVFGFLAYQWYLVATTGQSLGKRWMGIQIVCMDGSLPGFFHGVFLRTWVLGGITSIPMLGALLSFINVLMIFGDERRCLHDHIAGTRVIVAQSLV